MKIIKATKTERKILDSIKKVRKDGVSIVDSAWNVAWNDQKQKFECADGECCPLGALLVATGSGSVLPEKLRSRLDESGSDASYLEQAAEFLLDKDPTWASDFISAFDTENYFEGYDDEELTHTGSAAERAGAKIRKLVIKDE